MRMTLSPIVGLLMLPLVAAACPPYMDIGTFSISNYLGNGLAGSNLPNANSLADAFYNEGRTAIQNACGFSDSRGATFRDGAVKTDSMRDLNNVFGHREYNDVIFYVGHGVRALYPVAHAAPSNLPGFQFGANVAPYSTVYPDLSWNMGGSGYNRYFMAHSCTLFPHGAGLSTAAEYWTNMFRGLKVMMAYESYVPDNSNGTSLYNRFWTHWAADGWPLWMSFMMAETEFGYQYQGTFQGNHPGCLSAATTNWCNEKFTNADGAKAANGTGSYVSKAIMNPSYPP